MDAKKVALWSALAALVALAVCLLDPSLLTAVPGDGRGRRQVVELMAGSRPALLLTGLALGLLLGRAVRGAGGE